MSVDFAPRHRFTVDEFHRMGEAGILAHDDRVELINGEIFEMSPIGSRHARCVRRLDRWLHRVVGDKAVVSARQPLKLALDGEPIPDLAVLKPRADEYGDSHPTGTDALLVIEVADTSVLYDRNVKGELYAASGVPEYWVVDLNAHLVTVFGSPEQGRYTEQHDHARGDSWSASPLGGRMVSADEVLGDFSA
ncbi:MAG TPA: Uma2 family endonuclease [Longimicrobium sp.]|nr:Uma2 family endonuclease [Longimicrobium sp.]